MRRTVLRALPCPYYLAQTKVRLEQPGFDIAHGLLRALAREGFHDYFGAELITARAPADRGAACGITNRRDTDYGSCSSRGRR